MTEDKKVAIESNRQENKFDGEEIKIAEKEIKIHEEEIKIDEEEIKIDEEEIKMDEEEIKIAEKEIKIDEEEIKIAEKEIKIDKEEIKIAAKEKNIEENKNNDGEDINNDREEKSNGQEEINNDGEERNNEKLEQETELESAIIRQVEYYFGDLNLQRDKFLREQIELDDGWVPFDILNTFNRLAKLTNDIEVIAKALMKSTTGLFEISEDCKRVRRNPELPIPEMNEAWRKEVSSRTIYAKGFPKESELDDLLKYFKQFEDVQHVIMRKYLNQATMSKLFKGSVFATFKTKEQAEKFINTEGHKYNDIKLLIYWQDDYIKQKREEFAIKNEQREKKLKLKEQDENAKKEELKLPMGTVLHFSNVTDKIKRENIRDALKAIGAEVAYVNFNVGDKEGWVRLTKENTAKDLAEKLTDGKVKIEDTEVVFKVLSEKDENTYLDKTIEEISKRRKYLRNNFRGNRAKRGGGNYRHDGRKRKQDSDDGPPKKVKAADSQTSN